MDFKPNKTLFQAYEWYVPADGAHWRRLIDVLPSLGEIGITHMWIPPGCKGGSQHSNGYDVYDLFDLGEFDQKGGRATKWGTKEELKRMIDVAAQNGVGILWDTVLNHKGGADWPETCHAIKVDPYDRRRQISDAYEIESWSVFQFPGRGDRYSGFKYNWTHFNGTGYDARTGEFGVWKFAGKNWADDVSDEYGNYDFLMCTNLDYSNHYVREEVLRWGDWIGRELSLAGLRLDAIKHYSEGFLHEFIDHVNRDVGKNWFFVGEYWSGDVRLLSRQVRRFQGRLSFFDVPLVYRFAGASSARKCDLRTILDGSLCKRHPKNSVTFVHNHDTQETQALAAPVEPWFIPLAYSLILFRINSGYPCVFYGDIYGIKGPRPRQPACRGKLIRYVLARKLYAYGPQYDYLDTHSCVGWSRAGHPSASNGAGMAVVMTNGWEYASKRMYVGKRHSGERWTEIMGWVKGEVVIDRKGWGFFHTGPRSVGVWVDKKAAGRASLDGLRFNTDIYHELGYPSATHL